MEPNNRTRRPSRFDAISVLFFPPETSQAEVVSNALERHDIHVSVEYSVGQALDDLFTSSAECILVSDSYSSVTGIELLDAIRERTADFPVVFMLTQPSDELVETIDRSDVADYLHGDPESISYDRLAERIRAVVATYRTSRAQKSERDIVERLEDRIQRTERKITALHSVAMQLNATSTVDEVYRQTVNAAEEILDLDICFAFAASEDHFVPKAQSSTPTDRELHPVPLDAGAMGETYRTGTSERAVEMDLHTLADPAFGEYRSGISVPIGQFGVFQAVSKKSGAFDEIDLELTELLTAHAASVLQRLDFEEQLRLERDRYAALFENSTDCIVEAEFVERETVIRSVNPSFEEVFGYDESDVVGESIDDVVASEGRRDEARSLTRQVYNGAFVQAEVRRQTSEGLKDFLLRSIPVDDDILYGVYTDITDQKETERTITRQNEWLDTFASTVSHDLRNPLNVAMGNLELAREKHDNDYLEAVARSHTRIKELTEDLLTLAKKGDSALEVASVGLEEVTERCWSDIDTANASLVVDADCAVRADYGQLQQLLENLIRNAIMHGGDGVTVSIGTLDGGFYVEDDGSGISEGCHHDVFTTGYSTSEEGTGFGLSIVKQVAEAHDWSVDVTEGEDGGARFEFTDVTLVS